MSTSLKTLAARWPGSATGQAQNIARCCPRASLSTARPVCLARVPLRRQPFARPNHSLTAASRLSPKTRPTTTTTTTVTIASAVRPFSSATSSASPSAASKPQLDWNSFFKLRLRRRRVQLVFSVTTGILGGAGGAILLSTGLAEPLVMQIPLDPFVTLGLMTLACAGMGWLVGPSIGNQVFYILNHRFKAQMIEKESKFFARVKKHRVDPSNSSAGNPVPDFYGEKIQSVSGYRQWLKDQRAFNKKKTANFV
ncbi:Presequence translocated-associated motor subunit PAM17, mitochondrial [Tolypocladium ophioglossoides CBS 100239]|uniref:Presequence translocated-associated motor subunit PAM17 n=1 Tax=Tolypocladium ophioglossoides (strain CBS 100239) TaxID=1163406 RepID=A0A0L0N7G6_TOLOC|nr:Presequence translocated-associated motor subunit PAM17, mitochondrial [Tolypocladium ophioglossoides CBS 100239]